MTPCEKATGKVGHGESYSVLIGGTSTWIFTKNLRQQGLVLRHFYMGFYRMKIYGGTMDSILAIITSLFLLGYLTYAIFNPESF